MSIVGGSFGFSAGPANAMRFAPTRGRIGGAPMQGVNYPSPFFDVAHTYLPVTIKQMFRWCRYYFLTNPLINATVFKLSEYPVTDIVVDHQDAQVRKRWTSYFQEHLAIRPFQIECGLDYHAYGNSLVSIGFPFKKFLRCASCGFQERADKIRQHWTFTNYAFRLSCPGCGMTSESEAKDVYYKNASGINLIRWNCEHVEINYNDITGESTYFYTIPPAVRNDVVIGKKDVVESVPQVFIQAMRQQKGVVFAKDNFFHMKRATLAQQDRGWGIPLSLPVLKDVFYLQLMKKAQEAVLLEHMLPLRVLFPQAGSGTSDPYVTLNLRDWKDHIAAEIARWRLDPLYIPILPLPIGHQSIGGDGRALLLTQEIQVWSEQIMVGMGVPKEFLLGGLSYAGSSVSMRMLENAFLNYILRQKQLANWVMKMVAAYMDWPVARIRFKPFRMADDIQRKAYLFQLNQAQKISDTTLLADADLAQDEEDEIMLQETDKRLESTKKQQLALAEVQAEAQLILAKAQVKAQQVSQEALSAPVAPGEPGGPLDGMQSQLTAKSDMGLKQPDAMPGRGQMAGASITDLANLYAQQLSAVPEKQRELSLQTIEAQSPELAQLVRQILSQQEPGQDTTAGAAASAVDMRPLPEQRSPRRMAAAI